MSTKKPTVEQRLAELEKEVAELWEEKASDKTCDNLRENLVVLRDKVEANTEFRKFVLFATCCVGFIFAVIGVLTVVRGGL